MWRTIFVGLMALAFITACSSSEPKKEALKESPQVQPAEVKKEEHKVIHWSYEGEEGPAHWGDLAPEFAFCKNGKEQSPIDLIWKKPEKTGKLSFSYQGSKAKTLDTGHSIQLNLAGGNKVTINGASYELKQVHFHSPSEHSLSGKLMAAEAHFVHMNEKGQLAVVGVFFQLGHPHPVLEKILSTIPSEKGKEADLGETLVNPEMLKPAINTYYLYSGSLTTPPCSENVTWIVLNTPILLSKEQLSQLQKFHNNNNRPIQSLGTRKTVNFY